MKHDLLAYDSCLYFWSFVRLLSLMTSMKFFKHVTSLYSTVYLCLGCAIILFLGNWCGVLPSTTTKRFTCHKYFCWCLFLILRILPMQCLIMTFLYNLQVLIGFSVSSVHIELPACVLILPTKTRIMGKYYIFWVVFLNFW